MGVGGFVADLSGADIGLSSDGKRYLLSGTCTCDDDATDTGVDSLPLDERVQSSAGSLVYAAP